MIAFHCGSGFDIFVLYSYPDSGPCVVVKAVSIEGQLAGTRWRSKFGRPSKLPHLGDVDPTGSYCPVPEDWLMRKYGTTD
uniref:Uncharacterized protein n=1 Tax=Timema shepardi TaxID=629360 RepID=A0A7R9AQ44_TIMSH|nr:unnamed protein product [Timema shepardi]